MPSENRESLDAETDIQVIFDEVTRKLGDLQVDLAAIQETISGRPAVTKNVPDRGLKCPLNMFLWQEWNKMAALTSVLSQSLDKAKKHLDHKASTDEGADVLDCLCTGKVPGLWQAAGG